MFVGAVLPNKITAAGSMWCFLKDRDLFFIGSYPAEGCDGRGSFEAVYGTPVNYSGYRAFT